MDRLDLDKQSVDNVRFGRGIEKRNRVHTKGQPDFLCIYLAFKQVTSSHSSRPASKIAYVLRQSLSKHPASGVQCTCWGFRTHTTWLDRSLGGKYAHWANQLLPKARAVYRMVQWPGDGIEEIVWYGIKHFSIVEPCIIPGSLSHYLCSDEHYTPSNKTNPITLQTGELTTMIQIVSLQATAQTSTSQLSRVDPTSLYTFGCPGKRR
jgi:hypothetical protein